MENEMNLDRAKMTAMVSVMNALLASHPNKKGLREAFNFFADVSRDFVLFSGDFTEHHRRMHDETIDLFGEAIDMLTPSPRPKARRGARSG